VQTQQQNSANTDSIQDLRGGSPVALVQTTRRVTELLVEYRAYDFADRWDGLIQVVLGQLLKNPWPTDGDFESCLRRATLDEFSRHLRATISWNEDGDLPWCESSRMNERPTADSNSIAEQFRLEIEKLPEQRAQVINDVYGDGRSFDQIAAQRKVPLRMVKRFLRESIWDLRERSSKHRIWGRERGEERVKSCLKSLELDLPAFLVEPHLDEWREFRTHYPVCQDCSVIVANWSDVEAMVREACGGTRRHPKAEDLISLHRDGEGLAYSQYVALMRHLDGCPPCSEAMALLASLDRRPIAEQLIDRADRGNQHHHHRRGRVRNWFARTQARVRAHLEP
jgi:DNA-directed RNA polymerase specialized sigma24 family protein